MKKQAQRIYKFFRRLTAVHYRLTIYRHGRGIADRYICIGRRRLAESMKRHLLPGDLYVLYKTGPLFIPEREIDRGWAEEKQND